MCEEKLRIATEALIAARDLLTTTIPHFNWGASALSGYDIHLLNTVPGTVNRALEAILPPPVEPPPSEWALEPTTKEPYVDPNGRTTFVIKE